MKGVRRIDERVDEDTHQIRQYDRTMVRRVRYKMKACDEDKLDMLKTCFPEFLGTKKLKKLVPTAVVQGDSIIYKCPSMLTSHQASMCSLSSARVLSASIEDDSTNHKNSEQQTW